MSVQTFVNALFVLTFVIDSHPMIGANDLVRAFRSWIGMVQCNSVLKILEFPDSTVGISFQNQGKVKQSFVVLSQCHIRLAATIKTNLRRKELTLPMMFCQNSFGLGNRLLLFTLKVIGLILPGLLK